MMTRTRSFRLLSAVLVSASLLAACGSDAPSHATGGVGSDGSVDPVAMIQAASDKVLQAKALHMTFGMEISAAGQTISGSGEGDVSLEGLQQHMTFHFDRMAGLSDGMDMELILDGHVMYMRSSMFSQLPGLGTDWVSMDLNDTVPGFERLASFGTGQNDPSAAFGYLRGVEDAEVVGTEEIHGVETTHYRGTLSLEDALGQLPEDMQADFSQVMAQFRQQFGTVTMPFDVWVDADGQLRRMTYRMETDGGSMGAAGAFSMTMTIDITRYADHLTLDLPAAGDVTDVKDLSFG